METVECRILNKLERLQEDLADQLASMEEDWEEAINGENGQGLTG